MYLNILHNYYYLFIFSLTNSNSHACICLSLLSHPILFSTQKLWVVLYYFSSNRFQIHCNLASIFFFQLYYLNSSISKFLKKIELKISLGLAYGIVVGLCAFHITMTGFKFLISLHSCQNVSHTCHLCGRPRLSSRFLTLDWTNPGYWGHWGVTQQIIAHSVWLSVWLSDR